MLGNNAQHLLEIGWPVILLIWNLYMYPKIREQDKELVGITTLIIFVLLGFIPAMVAWFIMNVFSMYLKDEM